MNTPRRTIRMDDELWAEIQEAAAEQGLDVSSWVRDAARAALRASATVLVAVLAILTLGACGGAEPVAQPAATVTVDTNGQVISKPIVTVTVPATTMACWSFGGQDAVDLSNEYASIAPADVAAYEAFRATIPADSEACDQDSRDQLQFYRDNVANHIRDAQATS